MQIGRLGIDAFEWENANCNADFLYHGSRLMQMQDLLQKHKRDLTHREITFIEAGINHQDEKLKEVELRRNKELEDAKKLSSAQKNKFFLYRLIFFISFLSLEAEHYLQNHNSRF